MLWPALLDFLFPAQCAGCNALGSGLCVACAPIGVVGETLQLRGVRIAAYGAYDGVLRAAILALKDGRRDVAAALGARIAAFVAPRALLVPVPTTARRRRVRGIDGVALMAQRAADLRAGLVLPALEQHAGDAQRGRTRGERLAARGRFSCDAAVIGGRRVILVDDVCTTGATLADCGRAVSEAGGTVAGAVVAAVTKSRPSWSPPPSN